MIRYFLELAYNGKKYHGWQIQPKDVTVQSEIHRALRLIFRRDLSTTGSGRTDTGVHCRRQYAHFDLFEPIEDIEQKRYLLNRCLDNDIYISNILKPKDNESHARFQALSRSYEYHITQVKNPFKIGLAYHYGKLLDMQKMNQAAELMKQYENFESFSKRKTDVNHFYCSIYEAIWKLEGDDLVFYVTANRFLRGMVRTIVGTLIDVGRGATSLEEFQDIIEAKDRTHAGRAVPPQGLYLTDVVYPPDFFETA